MRTDRSGRPSQGAVRAVVVDIDGTLTEDSRRMNLDAVSALRDVEDSGVPVMLASGNVLPIAYAVSIYMGFGGPIIAENGGVVSYRQRIWLLGNPKSPRKALELLSREMDADLLFTDRWRETEVGLKQSINLERARELLADSEVEVQTTGWAVHIMEKGMDKFVGVRKACELLRIDPSQVAAIGDSENDERMMSECGWGVATGNADEKAKAAASHVTAGTNGAGVIEALAWLGLI